MYSSFSWLNLPLSTFMYNTIKPSNLPTNFLGQLYINEYKLTCYSVYPGKVCPVEAPGVVQFREACCVGISRAEVLPLTNPTNRWMECHIEVRPKSSYVCLVIDSSTIFKLLPMRHICFDLVIRFITNLSMLSFVFSRSDCQLTV